MPTPKQYADALSATPRNSWKYLADAMQPVSEFADEFKVKQDVPLIGGMSAADFTGLKGAFGLADDASYGKYPIRGASLQTAKVDPRVIDVMGLAGALMPVAKNVGKAALGEVARQIHTGTGIGRAALDPRMNMATVWHGSPHKFDKFDSSKIGTGEGAQAYGNGLYLADAREVGKEYQNKLSGWQSGTQAAVARNKGDLQAAIKEAEGGINHYKELINNGGGGMMERAKSLLGISQKKLADLHAMAAGKAENTGNLYKVDLPDEHIAKMLDWDKPLREQSKDVQTALAKLDPDLYHPKGDEYSLDEVGAETYLRMANSPLAKNQSDASEVMRNAGITGIRYLDGGSRGAGTGSSNYVVFPGNEGLLSILERNGQSMSVPAAELDSLNPTGGLMVDYTPSLRATQPLGKRMTTLDKTMGGSPDDMITIYRGAPKNQKGIVAGDFVTDMPELAKSYSGEGNVLKMNVRRGDVLDDITEPLGNEYIYRPKTATTKTKY